jgi:hypothetical protein
VTPRPLFTPGKDPVPIVREAEWASGPVWTGAENLVPTGIRSPDRPSRSQSLYRLSYPALNRSTTDHIFCCRQTLEKKWEYSEAVHQLFIDFKKAYDSVRMEALYNILIQFGISMTLAGLIKMCLNKNHSRVRAGKYMSDMFHIKNGLKEGDVLPPLLFIFALQHAIRRLQVNQDGLKLSGTNQLLVYADVNILGGSVHIK